MHADFIVAIAFPATLINQPACSQLHCTFAGVRGNIGKFCLQLLPGSQRNHGVFKETASIGDLLRVWKFSPTHSHDTFCHIQGCHRSLIADVGEIMLQVSVTQR